MITKIKLGEVSNLSIGFVGTVTSQYEDGGVPFFRTVNIKPYKIDDTDLKTMNHEFHESQKKSQLNKGDVAMVHTGVPGFCCVIPEEYDNSNCIDMIVIKPNKNKLDPFYLEAYMNTIGYKHITKQQVGANQKHFNLNDAIDLDIFVPDLLTQRKIGNFVNKINKKIEVNNRINENIINVIRLIFDYWFLQFEFPNEDNMPFASSGGEFVWNKELNKNIPVDWVVDNFGSGLSSNIIKTGIDDFNNKKIYIATADVIDFDIINTSNLIDINHKPSRANMQPIKNSIWFAKMIGSKKVILVGNYSNQIIDNYVFSTGFCGIECPEDYFYYLSAFVINENFEAIKDHLCAGSTMQAVKNDDVKEIKFSLPSEKILKKFNNIVKPMFKLLYKNNMENINLIEFREFVLPLLINGQVKFR